MLLREKRMDGRFITVKFYKQALCGFLGLFGSCVPYFVLQWPSVLVEGSSSRNPRWNLKYFKG